MVAHETLVINRFFPVSAERMFEALSSSEARAQWFVGPQGWVETRREHDFRVGGGEVMQGKFGDFTTSYTSHYYDIKTNERIVYSFDVVLGGKIFSASLATMTIESVEGGVTLSLTEQLAYIDSADPVSAHENRKVGTGSHFDNIAKFFGLDPESTLIPGETCKEAWKELQ